jgi:hypothetical protein
LLLEPQRSSLYTFSEQIDNADWGKTNVSVTANNTASPDGYTNADKVVANTTNGVHRIEQDRATATQVATQSVFAKASGYNFIALENGGELAYFNISTGVVGTVSAGTASIQNYGNGWYRCIFTATAANTKSYIYIASANNTASFAGDNTSGAFIYGAQFEAGAYATSYIPTTTAAVTRVVEGNTTLGTAQTLNNFTLFYEGSIFELNDNMIFGSGNSAWYLDVTFARVVIDLASGRKYQADLTLTANTSFKFVAKRTAGVFEAFLNGVKLTPIIQVTDALALSLSSIGWGYSSVQFPKMKISQVLAFQTALSDTQCIELTA